MADQSIASMTMQSRSRNRRRLQ